MPDRPDFIPTVRLPPEEGLFQPAHERRRQRLRELGWTETFTPAWRYWTIPGGNGHVTEEEALRWLEQAEHGTA